MLPKSLVLAKWLTIWGDAFSKELSPLTVEAYRRALVGISDDDMERACTLAFKECRFMPAVADILSRVSKREELANLDRCLSEWEAIVHYCKQWHPDTQWKTAKGDLPEPELSPRGEYALRMVGGYHALVTVMWDDEAMVFRKRDFEQGYNRHGEMVASGYTPIAESQAKQIIGKVQEELRQLTKGGSQ